MDWINTIFNQNIPKMATNEFAFRMIKSSKDKLSHAGAVAGSGQPGAKEQLLVLIRGMLHVITLPAGLESGAKCFNPGLWARMPPPGTATDPMTVIYILAGFAC